MIEEWRGTRHASLRTVSADGGTDSCPVWVAQDGTAGLVFRTFTRTRKVTRLRDNPEVAFAPCRRDGTLTGPYRPARAVVLSGAQARQAVQTLDRRHGLLRPLTDLFYRRRLGDPVVYRLVPLETTAFDCSSSTEPVTNTEHLLRFWVPVVGVLGLALPLVAAVVDRVHERPTVAATGLAAGLAGQIAVEATATALGRPELRPWIGLAGSLVRCAQLGLLFRTAAAQGASRPAILVNAAVWPANVVVLVLVLRRRRTQTSSSRR